MHTTSYVAVLGKYAARDQDSNLGPPGLAPQGRRSVNYDETVGCDHSTPHLSYHHDTLSNTWPVSAIDCIAQVGPKRNSRRQESTNAAVLAKRYVATRKILTTDPQLIVPTPLQLCYLGCLIRGELDL